MPLCLKYSIDNRSFCYEVISLNDRATFTRMLSQLLIEMSNEGDIPVIDYVLRSDEEQKRLFDKRLSKCDGKVKKSQHQNPVTAADIYLCDTKGNIIFDVEAKGNEHYKERMLYWHSYWDKLLGGEKRISWDYPHFAL